MPFDTRPSRNAGRCRRTSSVGRIGRTTGSTRSSAALSQPDTGSPTLVRLYKFDAGLFKRALQCLQDGSARFRGAALKLPERDLANEGSPSEGSLSPI
jgi:hypothetical protein